MAQLPQEFLTRMQDMLGDEFDAFLTSYDAPRTAGLRVNTKKCRTEDFPPLVPGTWKKIPWIPNGYFVPDGMRMGQSPLYAAGVFYLQEPSAMTPASRLPIEPGERVLDLCAAPGGKATELNARLKGTGLLVANDISNARAKALLRNLELFGSENVLVTNETPAGLADGFPGFFDKILVDTPCSGEGMFRKEEAAVTDWTEDTNAICANRQSEILASAAKMLRPGGFLCGSAARDHLECCQNAASGRPHDVFDMYLRPAGGRGNRFFPSGKLPGNGTDRDGRLRRFFKRQSSLGKRRSGDRKDRAHLAA